MEPAPAEEAEPDAFSVTVAGVTGLESFTVRRGDTLLSLQVRIAKKLVTPPEQQRVASGAGRIFVAQLKRSTQWVRACSDAK